MNILVYINSDVPENGIIQNTVMYSAMLLSNMGIFDLMQIEKHSSYIVFHKDWNRRF